MAKKSAMSKGYRKTVKKKPFLTKNDIIALIVIVVVIIAGVIIVDLVSKAGTIPASKVQPNDIISFASSEMRDRYVKLGTANELEGFVKEGGPSEEAPSGTYDYTPVDENDPMSSFTLSTAVFDANTAAEVTRNYYGSMMELSETFETTVYDQPAVVFSATSSYYDETIETEAAAEETAEAAEIVEAVEETAEVAETEAAAEETAEVAEEPAPNVFSQSISMYVDIDGERSIAMHAYLEGEDESVYVPDEEIVEYMQNLTGAFSLAE